MKRPPGSCAVVFGVVLMAMFLAGCGKEAGAKRHAEKADEAFNSGDYNRAEIEYKNLLRTDDNHLQALRRMGGIWQSRGCQLQAAHFLTRAKRLAPQDADLLVALGTALHSLGDRPGARNEALAALAISPSHGEALVLLATTSTADGEAEDAAKRVAQAGEPAKAAGSLATGILAMQRKDFSAAGAAIDRSLQLDPGFAKAHLWKADWHRARGEAAEAERALLEAVRLAPVRSPERVAYASFLLDAGKRDAAVEFLKKAAAEAPDFLPAWRMLARDAVGRKEPEEATKLLANVFAKDAVDFEAALLQCGIWLGQGGEKEIEKAVNLMEKLRESYPANPVVEVNLARAYLMAGKTDSAAETLKNALKESPDFRDAVLMQAALKLQAGGSADAAEAMTDWLAGHPNDAKALQMLVDAYRAQGKWEEAETVLKRVASAPGADASSQLQLGQLMREQGRLKEARESFEKAEALDPSNLRVAMELVRLDLLAGDPRSARRRAESQKGLHPDSAAARYLEATVHAQQAHWTEAEENLNAALKLEPEMIAARELLVKIYSSMGRVAEAGRQLEEVCRLDPGNVDAWITLGGIRERVGQNGEARECYENALARDPKSLAALNNLALILAESQDLEKARELAENARSLKPEEPAIADTLGLILFKQGKFKRSQELLGEAMGKLPEEPLVKFRYGLACRAMGDEAAALDALRGALSSGAEFAGKSEAVACLSKLEAPVERGDAGLRALEEQVKQDATDLVSRLRLAAALEAAGRHTDAAAAYESALKVNPEVHRAELALAKLHFVSLADSSKASRHALKARELKPDDAEAAAILGTLAFRAGEHERADGLLRESLSQINGDPGLMMLGARAAFSVGKIDEAKSLMERGVERSKDPSQQEDGRRFLELLKGECPAGKVAEALAADPSNVPALMARAALAEKDGKAATALEDYRKAFKLYPSFTPARAAIDRIEAAEAPVNR